MGLCQFKAVLRSSRRAAQTALQSAGLSLLWRWYAAFSRQPAKPIIPCPAPQSKQDSRVTVRFGRGLTWIVEIAAFLYFNICGVNKGINFSDFSRHARNCHFLVQEQFREFYHVDNKCIQWGKFS